MSSSRSPSGRQDDAEISIDEWVSVPREQEDNTQGPAPPYTEVGTLGSPDEEELAHSDEEKPYSEKAQEFPEDKKALPEEKGPSKEDKELMMEISIVEANLAAAQEKLPEMREAVDSCSAELAAANEKRDILYQERQALYDTRSDMYNYRGSLYNVRGALFTGRGNIYTERGAIYTRRGTIYSVWPRNEAALRTIERELGTIEQRIADQDLKIAAQDRVIENWDAEIAKHDRIIELKNQEIDRHSSATDPVRNQITDKQTSLDRQVRKIKAFTRDLVRLKARLAGEPEPGPEMSFIQLGGVNSSVHRFEDGPDGPCTVTFKRNGMTTVEHGGQSSLFGPGGISSFGSGCSIQSGGYRRHSPKTVITVNDGEGVVYAGGARIYYDYVSEAGGFVQLNVIAWDTVRVIPKVDTIEIWDVSNMPISMQ